MHTHSKHSTCCNFKYFYPIDGEKGKRTRKMSKSLLAKPKDRWFRTSRHVIYVLTYTCHHSARLISIKNNAYLMFRSWSNSHYILYKCMYNILCKAEAKSHLHTYFRCWAHFFLRFVVYGSNNLVWVKTSFFCSSNDFQLSCLEKKTYFFVHFQSTRRAIPWQCALCLKSKNGNKPNKKNIEKSNRKLLFSHLVIIIGIDDEISC